MATSRCSRPVGGRSQCAANGTRSTWATITCYAEQLDTIDPEASGSDAGQTTDRQCSVRQQVVDNACRATPTGSSPNLGSMSAPYSSGFTRCTALCRCSLLTPRLFRPIAHPGTSPTNQGRAKTAWMVSPLFILVAPLPR